MCARVLGSTERFNQFGENPAGYLGYSVDGRMYAIFVRQDRITPGDVVPTDEEGVKLLWHHRWRMRANFRSTRTRSFTISTCRGTKHGRARIQVRYYQLDGDNLTITTAPYRSYQDGRQGRSVLGVEEGACQRLLTQGVMDLR